MVPAAARQQHVPDDHRASAPRDVKRPVPGPRLQRAADAAGRVQHGPVHRVDVVHRRHGRLVHQQPDDLRPRHALRLHEPQLRACLVPRREVLGDDLRRVHQAAHLGRHRAVADVLRSLRRRDGADGRRPHHAVLQILRELDGGGIPAPGVRPPAHGAQHRGSLRHRRRRLHRRGRGAVLARALQQDGEGRPAAQGPRVAGGDPPPLDVHEHDRSHSGRLDVCVLLAGARHCVCRQGVPGRPALHLLHRRHLRLHDVQRPRVRCRLQHDHGTVLDEHRAGHQLRGELRPVPAGAAGARDQRGAQLEQRRPGGPDAQVAPHGPVHFVPGRWVPRRHDRSAEGARSN
mmetsp:Transcript_18448/g.57227  ORF Transcript_18448/g.57227 Transcript_18448/m.57227 type:complete len:345 (+) Transcript_18448:443-1477(+)